jgi:cation diffusion facilitator family transporter
MAGQGTAHITRALAANGAIALAKGGAAWATGSGAMLAEAIHSAADCGNQGLLLLGLGQARKPPSEAHPLGYGRALYFWSFIVALLLFSAGGVFSLYEGFHKLAHPEPLNKVWLGILILGFSLATEGWALSQAVRELHARRGSTPFWPYLGESKDSDLVVVFGEDVAACAGLAGAMGALILAWVTGNPMWDALGTILVGAILVVVAAFLSVEVKSLMLGESADPALVSAVKTAVAADARLGAPHEIVTLQQGPGEALVALKLACQPQLSAAELSSAINAFEVRLRAARPDAKWVFVEPDLLAR